MFFQRLCTGGQNGSDLKDPAAAADAMSCPCPPKIYGGLLSTDAYRLGIAGAIIKGRQQMNTNPVKCPLCGSWFSAGRISLAISEKASQPRPTARGTSEARACRSREPEAESMFPMFCRWPTSPYQIRRRVRSSGGQVIGKRIDSPAPSAPTGSGEACAVLSDI